MKITVFGAGYVGLVTAACLADMGNDVTVVDVDAARVAALQAGRTPIYEPGLEPLLQHGLQQGRLRFTLDAAAAVPGRAVLMIAVGTPPQADGSADLQHVLAVARTIGQHVSEYAVVVNKSTVPVGSAERVQQVLAQALAARGLHNGAAQALCDVVSNPEFLKEGAAVRDFQSPDRIIIGTASSRAANMMREMYAPFCRMRDRLLVMDVRSAEMSKYAANAMLAARISFMNEMAQLAEVLGADIEQVRVGIGSDARIGPQFLYAGIGFGGSCFPKDLQALESMAAARGVPLQMLPAIRHVNCKQKQWLFQRLHDFFDGDLDGRSVALWGLAFKPETDDVREAASLELIAALVQAGCHVRAYDPVAMPAMQRVLVQRLPQPQQALVTLCDTADAAVQGADVLALVTEWKQFRSPDLARLAATLRARAIFDGRNQYRPEQVRQYGLHYFGVGRMGVAQMQQRHAAAGLRAAWPAPDAVAFSFEERDASL